MRDCSAPAWTACWQLTYQDDAGGGQCSSAGDLTGRLRVKVSLAGRPHAVEKFRRGCLGEGVPSIAMVRQESGLRTDGGGVPEHPW